MSGYYVPCSTVGEICNAFVPNPLPPTPPLEITGTLKKIEDEALISLGRLDAISSLLPDPHLFLYTYVRKEAVLSSQIEGTQSTLTDLLIFERKGAPGVPREDVQEVSGYVKATDYALKAISENYPISIRLIKGVHRSLLEKGRGSSKDPGELKRTQNWVGGTRPGNAVFIPTPPNLVLECLGELEKYMNREQDASPLIKAALAHVQFETIHPFLDGNGRIGRLLITLILCADKALSQPLLYLSLYFKQHRKEYYDLLQQVRTEGDWEEWLQFFMLGVKETADLAVGTAKRLAAMFREDEERIRNSGRMAGSALRVHKAMQRGPVFSANEARNATGLSLPTANKTIQLLVKLGIAREITRQRRNRLFAYDRYLKILNEGTEPIK